MTAPLIVLLATLFVTMALAAMTLVPRPPPPSPRVTPIRPAAVAPTTRRAAIDVDLARCRAPVHRANPDGTVDVTFETCR